MKRLALAALTLAFFTGSAFAAVKSQSTNCTHAVRQGATQISVASGCVALPSVPNEPPRYTGEGALATACEAAARARTTNPLAAPRRTFTMKTGGGATIGTGPDRATCEATVRSRLLNDGLTRESGGNVNSCVVVTTWSATAGSPLCLSTTSLITSYKANLACAPIPGPNPRPMTCPAGMLGAWAQTGTRGPSCAEVWTPATYPAGDCFTLDRTASLAWTAPTRNTDGGTLTNLSGFRISYGVNPAALAQTVQIANAGTTRYVFTTLDPGTWYFNVRAHTSGGAESANSNTASKVVR